MKNVCSSKDTSEKIGNANPQRGERKSLQIIYLIRDVNAEYLKNFDNSTIKNVSNPV